MVNIIDVDETLGAPALNIGGEPAMAEVQKAGIETVTEPEALIPAETVAEHTADESELPSKSRPTASSRKAGPTTKKLPPKKKPGVKAVSPAKIPKHGLTVAEREELNELRMLREERNRKEREATEKLKAPEIRKIERDVISLSDDQDSDAVCLPSMVRVRQASPSPSPRAPRSRSPELPRSYRRQDSTRDHSPCDGNMGYAVQERLRQERIRESADEVRIDMARQRLEDAVYQCGQVCKKSGIVESIGHGSHGDASCQKI
jgi:hypothetical protein